MRELALLVMTAHPIPVEVKAAVPILLVRLFNIKYLSLHWVRRIYSK